MPTSPPSEPAPISTAPPERLDGLDALRAFAATSIIVFHMVHAANIAVPPALEFTRHYLGYGVPLFFVVSAFSLCFGYHERLRSRDDVVEFFVRRVARILPLFYAMLLFHLLLIYFVYGVRKSPAEIAASLTCSFNLVPSFVDGIVPASWSIGVEMLFYGIFPVLLFLVRSHWASLLALLVVSLAAALSTQDLNAAEKINPSFVHHRFLYCAPYFFFGILTFYCFRSLRSFLASRFARLTVPVAWLLLLLGIGGIAVLIRHSPLYLFFWNFGLRVTWDSLWGIPFGAICAAASLSSLSVISNPVTRYLGKVSFSLYLLHPNIVFFLGSSGTYTRIYELCGASKLAGFLVSVVFTVLIVTAISAITYRWIEAPGIALGRSLGKRLRSFRRPAPEASS